jgi:hypothetical protein
MPLRAYDAVLERERARADEFLAVPRSCTLPLLMT